MDFDDTPEEAAFRVEARSWLDAHATPKGAADDFSAGVWGSDYDEATYVERCRAWQRTLFEGGWAGITWPAAFGGRGGTAMQQVIFNQEQANYGVSTGAFMIALGMVGPTLLAHGSDEQKARYLPAMLRGDELWCQLFSEPGAGSDLTALATRAERDGDDWVVTGQKVWTSSAQRAAYGILLARTGDAASGRSGITYFVVDMGSAGIDQRPLRQMTGESHFCEVFLDEVRVPAANVVGSVGEGWRVARTTLTSERTSISGAGGVDPRALAALAGRFGRDSDPAVRQAIARAHTEAEVLRFLRYRMLTALSQGRRPGHEASIMKTVWSRYMKQLTATALAIKGPAGQLAETNGGPVTGNGNGAEAGTGPVDPDAAMWSRRFLHSPSLSIGGGTDEVHANIVAEQALGLPREPDVAGGTR